MGKVFVPAEKIFKGPWLIDSSQLEELDEIFEFIVQKLYQSYRAEVQRKVAEMQDENAFQSSKSIIKKIEADDLSKQYVRVSVTSYDGARIVDRSLNAILRDSRAKEFKPIELQLKVSLNESNYFSFVIESKSGGDVNLQFQSFDNDISDEIRYRIEKWIDKYQPSFYTKLMAKSSSMIRVVSFFVALLAGLSTFQKKTPDFKKQYRNDVIAIVNSGINESNEKKLLEALSKYMVDYKPTNIQSQTTISNTALRIFLVSILLFSLSFFIPETIIGIGLHKTVVVRQKLLSSIALVTIPTTFLIWPVLDWVKGFFWG